MNGDIWHSQVIEIVGSQLMKLRGREKESRGRWPWNWADFESVGVGHHWSSSSFSAPLPSHVELLHQKLWILEWWQAGHWFQKDSNSEGVAFGLCSFLLYILPPKVGAYCFFIWNFNVALLDSSLDCEALAGGVGKWGAVFAYCAVSTSHSASNPAGLPPANPGWTALKWKLTWGRWDLVLFLKISEGNSSFCHLAPSY